MTFCVLFVIFGAALAKLKIQSPVKMEEFPEPVNTDYSIANFGHIPYGKKMSAQLYAPPIDNDENYVQGLKLCEQPIVSHFSQYHKTFSDKWLIVRRGDCPFTKKAINAQNIQAKLLIIVDNKDEKVDQIMMADDGNGYQINIPSVLISKIDGEKILAFLTKYPQRYLIGYIEFKLNQTSNKTNVLFGLNIESRDTFKLINEFRPIYLDLQDHINISIFYEVLRCFTCEKNDWNSTKQDCLGGGRYCQFDPNGIAFGTGIDVLKEQLRQTCMWKSNPELWWAYMNHFSKKCTRENEFSKCFESFVSKEENTQIEKCVNSSYVDGPEKLQGENSYFEEHFQLRYQSGIIFYPGVSINKVAYRGNIEAIEIKEAICATFTDPPKACKDTEFIIEPNTQVQDSYFWLIVVVIVSSILFILFIKFIYRQRMKKNMNKMIQEQISQQVNNYVRFYESRSEK